MHDIQKYYEIFPYLNTGALLKPETVPEHYQEIMY